MSENENRDGGARFTPAYRAGYEDGKTAAMEAHRDGEDVGALLDRPGQSTASEALVNALSDDMYPRLYEVLGITRRQSLARGRVWEAALDLYDAGYQSAVRAFLAEAAAIRRARGEE